MHKVVDEHNTPVTKDASATEAIKYRQALSRAFILDEAEDLAKIYTHSNPDPGLFSGHLERCYRRGFEDAVITLAEKIASFFNLGLYDVMEVDHVLGWVLKDKEQINVAKEARKVKEEATEES